MTESKRHLGSFLEKPLKIVVIGAGPMGLAAAYRLSGQGHCVSVLEADDRIGGMSATFDFAGLAIERYYHFICKTDFPLFEALEKLDLSAVLRWRDTELGFYFQGQWYDWGKPMALLKFPHLSLVDKLRFVVHVLRTKGTQDWKKLDQLQAIDWIKSSVGERAYKVLWDKLFSLKFFEHQHNMSAAWIGTRIKRVALSRKNLFQEQMGYLEGGSAILLNAYRDKILTLGGIIRLGTPVRQLICEGGKIKGVDTGAEIIEADRVLSTIPLRYVARIAAGLNDDEKQRIDAIENIGVACVLLKLSKPATKYFWMNANDDRIEVPGFIEYSNLNPLSEPVVYIPYYMPKNHPKWVWSDERLLDEACAFFLMTQPQLGAADIVARHVSRYEYAQPLCPPGFYARLPEIKTSIDGFFMADTSYYYPEDRSISESIRIANIIADLAVAA
jgi:protoporphyrinogen oxidase